MFPDIFGLNDPLGLLHAEDCRINVVTVIFADAGMPLLIALLWSLRLGEAKCAQHCIISKHLILQRIGAESKCPQAKLCSGKDIGGGQAWYGTDTVRR